LDNVGSGETFAAYALVNDEPIATLAVLWMAILFPILKTVIPYLHPKVFFTENDLEWKDYSGEFPISKDAAIARKTGFG
jgi:hypothetical protein